MRSDLGTNIKLGEKFKEKSFTTQSLKDLLNKKADKIILTSVEAKKSLNLIVSIKTFPDNHKQKLNRTKQF